MGDTYELFWQKIFGSYLHRKDPVPANEDPKTNYASTLRLLKIYREVLNPEMAIWPFLDIEDYSFEIMNFVYIDMNRLKEINFIGITLRSKI